MLLHYATRWQWHDYTIAGGKKQPFCCLVGTDLKNIYITGHFKMSRSRYNQTRRRKKDNQEEPRMKQADRFSVRRLALIGMLAAMVFALTYVGIDIPTGLGKTKLHFGNVMCLLSALLLGPVGGGLAAGVGSALYDLMDPMWAPEFWITFLTKFAMAFVAGGIMHKAAVLPARSRVWIASLCGSLCYSALYLGKNVVESLYVKGFTWQVTQVEMLATKAPVTLFNGVAAVICASILYTALTPALRKAHVLAAQA